jgi:HD-like signal output (HDOD) protein
MENESKTDILEKLKAGYALPSLSTIAVKLIDLASDDTSSMEGLADLIGKDPSLTVRMLNLANSAFFKSLFPASTLKQAVMRIGFHHLRILALSLSLKDTFPMGKVGGMDYAQYWRVSLYRGLLAKSLARISRTCEPEEAFIGGLTLEIGFLIYFDMFLKKGSLDIDLGIYPLESLLSAEREKYGLNHREVGETALRYWRFPESIIACQSYYGDENDKAEFEELCKTCRIAGKLSALICYKRTDFNEVFQAIASSYGLDNETVYEAVVATLDEVDEIARALQVNVEHEKDLLGLLEKANRTLSGLSEQMLSQRYAGTSEDLPSFDSLRTKEGKDEEMIHTLEAVAHEIRNPLTVVGGFARRLAKTIDPASEGWKYVEVILKEAKRLEQALDEASKGLRA